MATDTAPAPRHATRHRNLWQLPTFLLGAAALAGVAVGREAWKPDPARVFARQLAAVRKAVDEAPPDPDAAVERGQKLLARAADFPELAGELNFLLGSGYLLRAEGQQGEAARDTLASARAHLEKADEQRDKLPDGDRSRLDYRLAKAWVLVGGDAAAAAERLARSVETAEDPVEGYKLLAKAHLAKSPPETLPAIKALTAALAQPGLKMLDPQATAPVRLQAGELYLSVGTPDAAEEGRKHLERVTPETPEAYYVARGLLARSYQQDANWAAVAQNLEKVRNDPGRPPAERRKLLYQLGLCYMHTSRPDDAARAWADKLLAGHDGPDPAPEARAAALRLAAIRVQRSEFAQAVPLLELGTRGLKAAGDYPAGELLPLAEARQTYEKAAAACLEQGEFEHALKAADHYAALAEGAADRKLAAAAHEAASAAADARAAKAEGDAAASHKADGRQADRKAAVEYRRWAEALPPADQVAPLRKASAAFLKAGEASLALDVLQKLAALPALPAEEAGEVQLARGETLRQLGRKPEALEAYGFAAQRPGPAAAKARLQAALVQMEQSRDEKAAGKAEAADALAQAALESLQGALDAKPPPDAATHEAALYAAGDALYQQGAYAKSGRRLAEALKLFPDNPRALAAKYKVGRCAWYEALAERKAADEPKLDAAVREARIQQYRAFLKQAFEPTEAVESALQEMAANGPLPPAEAILWRQASFLAADCKFFLEEFEDAQTRYGHLAARFKGQVEELVALSQVWQCHTYLALRDRDQAQAEAAKKAFERFRDTFEKMPGAAFDGSTPMHARDYWQKWVERAVAGSAPAK